jgi:hypothetical protein
VRWPPLVTLTVLLAGCSAVESPAAGQEPSSPAFEPQSFAANTAAFTCVDLVVFSCVGRFDYANSSGVLVEAPQNATRAQVTLAWGDGADTLSVATYDEEGNERSWGDQASPYAFVVDDIHPNFGIRADHPKERIRNGEHVPYDILVEFS